MDKEKVIKGLEETEIMLKQAVDRGGEMAVMGAFKCLNNVTDALALLKEQEAVEPRNTYSETPSGKFIPHIFCGKCNKEIYAIYAFCPFCGQAVKWDE